ncbi:MAG: creatininase family protein [Gemmatimonadetes bacterium]|nr:creatininase family protein [Gemmatimonadota bacterium]MBT7863076.1 creatininase family protein [Gemmatimonadota bacterium]
MITGEVRLWKLTRKQVRERLEAGQMRAAILPTGSTEQHNEHLAMEHDTASALVVAEQAALALFPDVVVATPIAVGISEHWMEWKGTLSLRPETFYQIAFDVCESLKRHGIEHIFICNGHAGNGSLLGQMDRFREELGIDVRFHSYWEAYSEEFVNEHLTSGDCPAHAAEFETSVALAAFPGNAHWDNVNYDAESFDIQWEHYREQDPVYHYAARDLATPAKGRIMIDAAANWVANQVKNMRGDPVS